MPIFPQQGGHPYAGIRLIALDLDGTVFDDEKRISPRTLAAIRAALDRGIDVLPATGRNAAGVPDAFMQMPGGAVCADFQRRKRGWNWPAAGRWCGCRLRQTLRAGRLRPYSRLAAPSGCLSAGIVTLTRPARLRRWPSCPPALLPYIKASRRVTDNLDALIAQRPGEVEKFSMPVPGSPPRRDAARAAVVAACPEH